MSLVHDRSPTRIDRLRIAFAVRTARRIVDADGVLDLTEIEMLSRTFPSSLLRKAGFLDARDQLTPEVDRVYRQALAELPRVLTMTEKLELVTLFHRTCDVDGDIHPRELDVLREAAAMLAVPRGTLDDHLLSLWTGTIVPPLERADRR